MNNDVLGVDTRDVESRDAAMPRPGPPRSVLALANDWLAWFGLGRLVLAALSVLVVAGGAVWLLQAPPPSVESTLPLARNGTSPTSTVTLPVAATPPAPSGSPTTSPDESQVAPPTPIVVHVAGAVVNPGVYQLTTSARVSDAVSAAGGANEVADTDRLNLAAVVEDGQRVYVPALGGTVPPEVVAGSPNDSRAQPTGNPAGAPNTPTGPLDLNTATADELDKLPGVGPATAAAIVDDRERNGPFASVEDLDRVTGIGPAKLAALAELVTV